MRKLIALIWKIITNIVVVGIDKLYSDIKEINGRKD